MISSPKSSFLLALVLQVMLQNKGCTGCTVWLESPLVTDYGNDGDLVACPGGGMFVTGMQLKTEPITPAHDNTALNAIAFFCNSPLCGDEPHGRPSIESQTTLTSAVGQWGNWGSIFNCPNYGYVVGFQMRSQVEQGAGDNTASNNLRIVCNDGSGKLTVFEGDGTSLGDWTAPQLCPQGMAFTAMETQVENDQNENDHTALNRLFVYCTDAPFPC